MKKTKIMFWIFTGLFGAFMLFTAIPNIIMEADSVKFITSLGYPEYIIPFLGIGKTLGVIAILIPGFPRLKEWAYAGLFFDLIGATHSIIALNGLKPDMLPMLIPFVLGALSYYFHLKKQKESQV
jgi:hypothetical protein